MKKLKIVMLALSVLVVSALVFSTTSLAQGVKAGDSVAVVYGETVDGMLFAGGNNVNIAGVVNGDVYCAGKSVSISGTVKGDVFCAGDVINISGTIEGSARLVGSNVTVSGSVNGSASVAASTLLVDQNGKLGRDLMGGVGTANINGSVARDVAIGAGDLTIAGKVGRDIDGDVTNLVISSTGLVSGHVNYTSENTIAVNAGGRVVGSVSRTIPEKQSSGAISSATVLAWVVSAIYGILSTMAIGLVVVLLFPALLKNSAIKTPQALGWAVLIGLGVAIVGPILAVTLAITGIGFPLAIIVLLLWVVAMIISSAFASYSLGGLILKNGHPVVVTIIGASIIGLLAAIPYLGALVVFAVFLVGAGVFSSATFARLRRAA